MLAFRQSVVLQALQAKEKDRHSGRMRRRSAMSTRNSDPLLRLLIDQPRCLDRGECPLRQQLGEGERGQVRTGRGRSQEATKDTRSQVS